MLNLRRTRNKVLIGVVGLAAAGGGLKMSPVMADEVVTRTLQINGTANIMDYENIGANERCNGRKFTGVDQADTAYGRQAIARGSARCGGEIRVEVHGYGTLQPDGRFCNLRAEVLFFEGTSESTSDLDGKETMSISGCLGKGSTTRERKIHVFNKAESEVDDKADVWFTMSNFG
jgi:hypothetical protein